MSGISSPKGRILRATVLIGALFGLSACSEGQMPAFLQAKPGGGEEVTRGAGGLGARTTERDVEAPEIFSAKEAGLWDGRPSLGGVWVAHPDVSEPERAIIRNTSNGKFVIGALFRKERQTPGPRLQVSSDAAAALGMLAGQPANLDVVALRREKAPVQDAPTADSEALTETAVPAAPEVSEGTLDPVLDSAAKALDAAPVTPAPAPLPRSKPPLWHPPPSSANPISRSASSRFSRTPRTPPPRCARRAWCQP